MPRNQPTARDGQLKSRPHPQPSALSTPLVSCAALAAVSWQLSAVSGSWSLGLATPSYNTLSRKGCKSTCLEVYLPTAALNCKGFSQTRATQQNLTRKTSGDIECQTDERGKLVTDLRNSQCVGDVAVAVDVAIQNTFTGTFQRFSSEDYTTVHSHYLTCFCSYYERI